MALKRELGTNYPFGSLAFCIKNWNRAKTNGLSPVIYCSLWLIFVFSHKEQEKQEVESSIGISHKEQEKQERYLPSILQLQL